MRLPNPFALAREGLRRGRAICLGLGVSMLAAVASAQTATLALPANALLFAPIYVAADAGLWKQRGLDVKLPVIAGPGATNAVIAGSADFTSTAATSVLRASARGQMMQIIASTNDEYLLNLVLSKKAITERKIDLKADLATRLKALKGATLAIDAPLGLPHGFIKYMAAKVGMDADRDFVLTPMQPPNMVSSLASGAIDGFLFGEPFVSLAVAGGAQIAVQLARVDVPDLNPYATNVIAARAGFCKQSPTVCSKLVAGITDALKMIQDDPERVKGLMRVRFGQLPTQVLDASFEQIRVTSPRSAVVHEATLANTQRVGLVSGTLKPEERRDDLAALIDNEFAK